VLAFFFVWSAVIIFHLPDGGFLPCYNCRLWIKSWLIQVMYKFA